MKKTLLLLALIALTGCNEGGGGGSSGGSSGSDPVPTVATPDNSNITPAPVDPVVTPDPTVTPPPPVVVPAFSCYSNAGVFCTGGNAYPSTIQLDMDAMFIGGNTGETITGTSVANNIVAYSGGLCSQPSGYQAGCAGGHVPSCLCHAASTCVAVTIHVTGGNFQVTKCGNGVTNYQLSMQ